VALIHQQTHQGTHYQIIAAGNSVRLYTDKVLHSQYNHKTQLTGSVWDLLFLPALVLPTTAPIRVLVLGVGGGAVLKMLNEYFNCSNITGIELNPIHIQLAQNYFAIKGKEYELIEADAIEYVKNYRGEKFDLIIDDLFYEEEGEPMKVASPDNCWLMHLYALLKPQGVIAMNFVGRNAAFSAAPLHDQYLSRLLPNALHFTTPYYDNHVLAFSAADMSARQIRQNIIQHPKLSKKRSLFRYRCVRL